MTDDQLLYHCEYNEAGKDSVVFLHGLCSNHKEWLHVIRQDSLRDYHLILLDMPGHSQSQHFGPWTLQSTTDHVIKLIQAKAHGGTAHLVGLSAGGFAALQIAKLHPAVVRSLIISGVYDLKARCGFLLRLEPILGGLQSLLPKSFTRSMYDRWNLDLPDGLFEDIIDNETARKNSGKWQKLATFFEGKEWHLATRTLAICAALHDSPEQTRQLGQELKQGNPSSVAVQIKDAYHGWSVQQPDFPALFATTIVSWIEKQPLPDRLLPL